MHSTGMGIKAISGSPLVQLLRDDPAVWWSWTETAARVRRLYHELRANLRDLANPGEAAVEDLADRLSWSFGGSGLCRERADWCAAAEELLAAVPVAA